MPRALPKLQRVAAYALIIRDEKILLTRLASRISADGKWHLPGGGLDHGENPRDALVREIREETGLDADVGDSAHVYSAHLPSMWRHGKRWDYQALRIVYDAWVPPDAPAPHVEEVDGSTVAVAWHPVADVLSGVLPVTDIVTEALADHSSFRMQRIGVYALIRRDDALLLTRISQRGFHSGSWTLPGGGLDHGESPREGLAREVREECGVACEVGDLLDVHDLHFGGVAPSGRFEDFHGVHLLFRATVAADAEPCVVEVDGTTDIVTGALADHSSFRMQRIGVYALIRRDDTVLLTRISQRGFHSGSWTLPGGGLDHGESPREGLAREVREECGVACEVGDLLDVHDLHFGGVAPSGRFEDFHGVHLLFRATVAADAEPSVAEVDGTTDAVAWVPLGEIDNGVRPVLDVVRAALAADPR